MIAEQIEKKKAPNNKEQVLSKKARVPQNQVLDLDQSNVKKVRGQNMLKYAAIVVLSVWLFYAIEEMPLIKWQVIASYIIVMSVITLNLIENKKVTKTVMKKVTQKPTNMQMTITDVLQKINILEGYYTTSEAADIINQFIDVKINHHKLQILSKRIQNENAKSDYHSGRIEELIIEKAKLKSYLNSARRDGKQVQMNAEVEITFI